VYLVSNNYNNSSTPWTETGLTWNNAPAISGTPLSSSGGAAVLNTWVELDVTAAIQGDGTYSFGITNTSDEVRYGSKDGSSNHPELVLTLGSGPPPPPPPAPELVVTPSNHNYGSVVVGNSSATTFEVRNDGNADLMVSGTTLVGTNSGEFSITNGGGAFTLVTGATRNVEVRFNPITSGGKNASLRINSNDFTANPLDVALTGTGTAVPAPDVAVTPGSHNYGQVLVGSSSSKIFKVENTGTAALEASAVTVTGTNAAEFVIASGGGSFTLAVGASHDVTVDFSPASGGSKSAKLQIDSNDPDENPLEVALSGTGNTPLPDITVTPSSNNYGNVLVGSISSKTFAVRNDGTADLQVSGTTLVGADAGEFFIDSGGGPFTLTPSQSRNVVVNFSPSSLGAKSAALRITSDDPDESSLDVTLTGTGVETPPSSGTVTFEEVKTGGSTGVSSVTTSASLSGVSGHLYLAAISTKSFSTVSNVSGLGLTWTRVRSQCAGRNQTGVEVWMAQGSPSASGTVTATLSGTPKTAVIMVCRYSGADAANPIGAMVSGNTVGTSGSCSGGSDNSSYSFNLTTTVSGSVVYGVAGIRNKTHTPGAGYTERAEFILGSSSDGAGLAVQDKTVASPTTVAVNGSFSSTVDWAVIGIEIRPQGAIAKLAANSDEKMVTHEEIPTQYQLFNNYPNPFNAETIIDYTLPEDAHVQLQIFNIRGQIVRTLVDGFQTIGIKHARWDSRDDFGNEVGAGVYFIRLKAGQHIFTRRTLLQE
jgi:hypothetical protein